MVGIAQGYNDLCLGLADASLVALAARLQTTTVAAFDERNFRGGASDRRESCFPTGSHSAKYRTAPEAVAGHASGPSSPPLSVRSVERRSGDVFPNAGPGGLLGVETP